MPQEFSGHKPETLSEQGLSRKLLLNLVLGCIGDMKLLQNMLCTYDLSWHSRNQMMKGGNIFFHLRIGRTVHGIAHSDCKTPCSGFSWSQEVRAEEISNPVVRNKTVRTVNLFVYRFALP